MSGAKFMLQDGAAAKNNMADWAVMHLAAIDLIDEVRRQLWLAEMRQAQAEEKLRTAAEQERREFDWESVAQFNRGALAALERQRPESGIEPVMPIYDYLRGFPAPTLQGEDVSTDAFCDSLSASERAIIQYRGELSEALAFPGSLRRAPALRRARWRPASLATCASATSR